MPGYVIHLAIGSVYSKNNNIQDIKSFQKGIIDPDIIKDKSKSHYGSYSSNPNLNRFIRERGITTSYEEGYFLHLVSDYLFYKKFLKSWNTVIYEDYDKLNARIIRKYGIEIPEEAKPVIRFKDGELSFLKEEEIYRFIEAVGKIGIRQIVSQKDSDYERKISSQLDDTILLEGK